MTNDRSSRPPPLGTELSPVESAALGGCDSPGISTIATTAAALEVSPIELPPLNETVDMDALDSLLERPPAEAAWPVVEFSYAGQRIRLAPDRGVEPVDTESIDSSLDRRWSHVSPVETAANRSLMVDVVGAFTERADREPQSVRDALTDLIDFDALEALSRPRANGLDRPGASVRFSVHGVDAVVDTDGTVSVGPASERIAHAGGNVLVVGDVPDTLLESAAAGLSGGRHQRRLLALLDRDVGTVNRSLSPAEASSAHVINHITALRSTARPDPVSARSLSVTDVSGDLAAVRDAIADKLCELGESNGDNQSLCFSLSTLRPVVEARDASGVRTFLEPVCESATASGAVGSYALPVDRTTTPVPEIETLFDATLELRVHGTVAERRWHFHRSGYATDWRPFTD